MANCIAFNTTLYYFRRKVHIDAFYDIIYTKLKTTILEKRNYMDFKINTHKKTEEATYKTLYIRQSLIWKIEKIAYENNTSFNNVIISMIKACLEKK